MSKEYDFPQGQIEFRGMWSHAAEKNATLQGVVNTLKIRSGELFVADKIEMAEELKSLAKKFEALRQEAENELRACIAEDGRRREKAFKEKK